MRSEAPPPPTLLESRTSEASWSLECRDHSQDGTGGDMAPTTLHIAPLWNMGQLGGYQLGDKTAAGALPPNFPSPEVARTLPGDIPKQQGQS